MTSVIPEARLVDNTGGVVRSATSARASTGTRVFTNSFHGTEFHGPGEDLRINFTAPVSSVSIDAIGTAPAQRGLLRNFNAANQQIGSFTTDPLNAGQVQTMTLTRPAADIAYALASSASSSFFVALDNLRFAATSEPAAFTGAGGAYNLVGLIPGTNIIREVAQPNWQLTAPAGGFHAVSISTSGQAVTGRDFGNRSGTISGIKYRDTNANGSMDKGEPGLVGWTIYLDLNNNGSREANEPSQLTDAQGRYLFNGLAAGTYVVREIVQNGWILIAPSAGFFSVTIVDTTTVASGRDFGNFQLATVAGLLSFA